jgi:hypothetical protein
MTWQQNALAGRTSRPCRGVWATQGLLVVVWVRGSRGQPEKPLTWETPGKGRLPQFRRFSA